MDAHLSYILLIRVSCDMIIVVVLELWMDGFLGTTRGKYFNVAFAHWHRGPKPDTRDCGEGLA